MGDHRRAPPIPPRERATQHPCRGPAVMTRRARGPSAAGLSPRRCHAEVGPLPKVLVHPADPAKKPVAGRPLFVAGWAFIVSGRLAVGQAGACAASPRVTPGACLPLCMVAQAARADRVGLARVACGVAPSRYGTPRRCPPKSASHSPARESDPAICLPRARRYEAAGTRPLRRRAEPTALPRGGRAPAEGSGASCISGREAVGG